MSDKRTTCPVHGERFIEPMELHKVDPKTGREWSERNANAGRCSACTDYNVNDYRAGRAKRQPLREVRAKPRGPAKREVGPGYIVTDAFHVPPADFARFLTRLGDGKEPERASELAAASRRPAGTSSAAYGVAIRRASRTPMLNADAAGVTDALARGERETYKMPTQGMVKQLIVKPKALAVGKIAGWWERRWTLHSLKYAKGFCIKTDDGKYSKAFRTIGELESAVRKSGWEIIR